MVWCSFFFFLGCMVWGYSEYLFGDMVDIYN